LNYTETDDLKYPAEYIKPLKGKVFDARHTIKYDQSQSRTRIC